MFDTFLCQFLALFSPLCYGLLLFWLFVLLCDIMTAHWNAKCLFLSAQSPVTAITGSLDHFLSFFQYWYHIKLEEIHWYQPSLPTKSCWGKGLNNIWKLGYILQFLAQTKQFFAFSTNVIFPPIFKLRIWIFLHIKQSWNCTDTNYRPIAFKGCMSFLHLLPIRGFLSSCKWPPSNGQNMQFLQKSLKYQTFWCQLRAWIILWCSSRSWWHSVVFRSDVLSFLSIL